ncbi:MAG: hypothetical protein MHPSP_001025 [Paramarteilia canceri]
MKILFFNISLVNLEFLDESNKVPKPGTNCTDDVLTNANKIAFVNGYPLEAKCTDAFVVCTSVEGKYAWVYATASDLAKESEFEDAIHRHIFQGLQYILQNCDSSEGSVFWCRSAIYGLGRDICRFDNGTFSLNCSNKTEEDCKPAVESMTEEDRNLLKGSGPEEMNEMSKYMLPKFKNLLFGSTRALAVEAPI